MEMCPGVLSDVCTHGDYQLTVGVFSSSVPPDLLRLGLTKTEVCYLGQTG